MTDESPTLKWLRKQKTLEARYRRSGSTGYVLVMFGGRRGGHLHIDVAAPDFFPKKRPSPANKIAEVREALDRLAGYDINLRTNGVYYIAQNRLPPSIQATIAETTTVRDVSIRTTGGTLSVAGAPIDLIRWQFREGKGDVRVELEAKKTATLDDGYLEECLAILDSAFEAFVLQDKK